MSKIVNASNLPASIYRLLVNILNRDDYTKGAAHLSVTQLIGPPRIRVLRQLHDAEVEIDAASSLWQLIGRAMHKVLEGGADAGHRAEERLFATVGGVRISGAMDLQEEGVTVPSLHVNDWKMTSVFALKETKPEWEQQLNMYAELCRLNGRTPTRLTVTAILRDWSHTKIQNYSDYPQAPIQVVDVPMWTPQDANDYLHKRIELHLEAQRAADFGEPLPLCTKEERWEREDKFAVMKVGGKRAVKVYDTEAEAMAHPGVLQRGSQLRIEKRPGEPIRCLSYCSVSRWCTFGQQALAASTIKGVKDE
jgi:hypothetical protein